jgi:hypothetical protein
MLIDIEKVAGRLRQLIKGYLLRFGRAHTGLYRFQNVATQDWATYLAVVNITLNREGMRPAHIWLREGDDVLLLLCVNGYFRTNLNDVTDILMRLWSRRTPGSIPTLIDAGAADATNAEQAIWRLYQTIGRFTFVQPHAYRKHGFGSSMVCG